MHTHPEVRDDHLKRAAAQLAAAGACAEACPNAAAVVVRVTMPDTLAQVDYPMCAAHGYAYADENDAALVLGTTTR